MILDEILLESAHSISRCPDIFNYMHKCDINFIEIKVINYTNVINEMKAHHQQLCENKFILLKPYYFYGIYIDTVIISPGVENRIYGLSFLSINKYTIVLQKFRNYAWERNSNLLSLIYPNGQYIDIVCIPPAFVVGRRKKRKTL